jgi:hypothetical protein
MPSAYLTTEGAAAFGAPSSNSNEISAASALLDAYLKRPEGLVWAPDYAGQPCYMPALLPAPLSIALPAAIQPGTNVAVALPAPTNMLSVGDVLVLDRQSSEPNVCEACVVSTTTANANGMTAAITLQTVLNAHAQGAAMEWGLVIVEKRQMPASRPITMLSRIPLMRLISGIGRYAYGRRGDGANYNMEQFNLLAALSKFGGPPVWELWQPNLANTWDASTGQVWVPAGIMLAYYSEVRIQYVAGFAAAGVPAMVQFATAQVMRALKQQPGSGNIKSFKAGDTAQVNFVASALDADTRVALRPFMSRAYL